MINIKGSYLEDYIQELTTIELDDPGDCTNLERRELANLSAKRYSPSGSYQAELARLQQFVFTEISMSSSAEVHGLIVRLKEAKERIERAKSVWEQHAPMYGKQFDWPRFQREYFHEFTIKIYPFDRELQPDRKTIERLMNHLGFAQNCKWLSLFWLLEKVSRLVALSDVDGQGETLIPKLSKRINSEAQEKHNRLFAAYDRYIKNGYTHKAALDRLVHDFRYEYNQKDAGNRRKSIQAIIRKRNNKG